MTRTNKHEPGRQSAPRLRPPNSPTHLHPRRWRWCAQRRGWLLWRHTCLPAWLGSAACLEWVGDCEDCERAVQYMSASLAWISCAHVGEEYCDGGSTVPACLPSHHLRQTPHQPRIYPASSPPTHRPTRRPSTHLELPNGVPKLRALMDIGQHGVQAGLQHRRGEGGRGGGWDALWRGSGRGQAQQQRESPPPSTTEARSTLPVPECYPAGPPTVSDARNTAQLSVPHSHLELLHKRRACMMPRGPADSTRRS